MFATFFSCRSMQTYVIQPVGDGVRFPADAVAIIVVPVLHQLVGRETPCLLVIGTLISATGVQRFRADSR